jgi:hydrogenase 3 maturation protease
MKDSSASHFTPEFVTAIDEFLQDAKKFAILGIGNVDNGDDSVALYVVELLQKMKLPDWITVFYCERVPEHFLGKLDKLKPNRILILDAADMHEEPGAIAIIPKEIISKGFHFSTHTLSLIMLEEYLKPSINELKIMYMGIQTKVVLFETPLSEECKKAAEELSVLLQERIIFYSQKEI